MRLRAATAAFAVCVLVSVTAAADIEIHQKHRFDAKRGATVVVEASFHNVEVIARPSDVVDVTVDITVKGSGSSAKNVANDLSPVFQEEGENLIIRSVRKKGWSWRRVSAKGKVTVQMPPGMNLSIDSSSGSAEIKGDFEDAVVRFDASSGSLTVAGVMGELHSNTSSGSVRASVEKPIELLDASASSGSIHLSGGARHAKVSTSSGSIDLSGLHGPGSFSASSGSIKGQWSEIAPATRVRASASSGSVTLRFPESTRVSGSVQVSSGALQCDFPAMVRGKKRLELDGGPEAIDVEVSTSSGNVKLLAD
jgi:DUF4097 and DUF4098 domain-containing protein YvlB